MASSKNKPVSKQENLLDMLYGWGRSLELANKKNVKKIDTVYDLYQKSANVDDTDAAITEFITNEVLPVILGKKK